MFVRVFRGTAKPGSEADVDEAIRNETLPMLEALDDAPEVIYGKSADGRSFLVITTWDDEDACKEAMGADLTRPKFPNENVESMIESFTLDHYEAE